MLKLKTVSIVKMEQSFEKRRKIESCIRRSIIVSMLLPQHWDRFVSKRWKPYMRLLEHFFELLSYCLFLHVVLILLNVYFNFRKGDFEFICHCMSQAIVLSWALWAKVYYRRINVRLFLELLDYFQKNYRTRSAPGFTYVTIDDAFKKAGYLIWGFTLASSSVLILFWLPMLSGQRHLPLPCWYPFDYKKPFVYELVYFVEFVTEVQIVFSFCASSGFYFVLSLIAAGQFDVLNCSLKNILATAYVLMDASTEELLELKESQALSNGELNVYRVSKEHHLDSMKALKFIRPRHLPKPSNLSAAIRQALIDCVFHHMFILEVLKKMEKFYHILWLIKSGQFISLMCLLGFVYAKSDDTSVKANVAMIAEYMTLALGELFLIFHFSEMIRHCSQSCGEAIMRCPWQLHIRELKHDLMFFLLHSTRSFNISAGKLYFINYERFRAILTTSFSFVTILQTMEKRQSKLINQ